MEFPRSRFPTHSRRYEGGIVRAVAQYMTLIILPALHGRHRVPADERSQGWRFVCRDCTIPCARLQVHLSFVLRGARGDDSAAKFLASRPH